MSVLIHDSIEFHNVAALEPRAGLPGLTLVRIPRSVRQHLNPSARFTGAHSTGAEVRFVTDAPMVRIAFAAQENDTQLEVYRGGFGHSDHSMAAGTTRVLQLADPEHLRLFDISESDTGPFSPAVWRIVVSGGCAAFLGIDAPGFEVRPPNADEKPRIRWLAHGSSITHSWSKGYPHMAARQLGVDVLNKGLSGSCHCEAEVAEHFASNETWDFATLELGVNMRGVYSVETFRDRATHFVRCLREARPKAPVALITHYLNRDHFPQANGQQSAAKKIQDAFDDVLRELASQGDENLHLIEGQDILADLEGLSCDLLHPSQYGHIQMGQNLAEKLRPLIAELPGA